MVPHFNSAVPFAEGYGAKDANRYDCFSNAFLRMPHLKSMSAHAGSTGRSPMGSSAPSLASAVWAGNSSSVCACARMAASAARAVHRLARERAARSLRLSTSPREPPELHQHFSIEPSLNNANPGLASAHG